MEPNEKPQWITNCFSWVSVALFVVFVLFNISPTEIWEHVEHETQTVSSSKEVLNKLPVSLSSACSQISDG